MPCNILKDWIRLYSVVFFLSDTTAGLNSCIHSCNYCFKPSVINRGSDLSKRRWFLHLPDDFDLIGDAGVFLPAVGLLGRCMSGHFSEIPVQYEMTQSCFSNT